MKIIAITTIRSDYDLNSNLYRLLDSDPEINLKLLVAGAHLSKDFGKTVNFIEEDSFDILLKTESLLASDSKQARIKSASIMLSSWIDAVSTFNPDLIIYSGDREDVMVASIIAAYLEIPSIHIFSGDHEKDGHVDNSIRHAASKLSSIFFVSTEMHRQRLMSLGENPNRIFNIGSISLDKFYDHNKDSKKSIKRKVGIPDKINKYAVVIFHPISKEIYILQDIVKNILDSLIESGVYPVASFPNTDFGNNKIVSILKQYEQKKCITLYKSLDRNTFLSLYKNADLIIGNSSSGIIESASIPIPAINVGLRQQGREAGRNVIFCGTSKAEIFHAVQKSMSKDFLKEIKSIKNIYGDGKSSIRAYNLIKQIDFKKFIFKTEDPLELQ
jgi:UDP-hydrolysing UDP-N-acetyl-D-glucosamine 2-epimerase